MDLWEAIEGRRSIRHFTEDPVPDSDLLRIAAAAGKAPSGANQQMWRFVAIRNKELLGKMSQAVLDKLDEMAAWPEAQDFIPRLRSLKHTGTFFVNAPVAVAVLTEPYRNPLESKLLPAHGLSFEQIHRLRGDAGSQSVGAAIMTFCLGAQALGYGTCWMCGPLFAGEELEKLLGVEEPWYLKAVIALGVPAEHPEPRSRLDVSEIIRIID